MRPVPPRAGLFFCAERAVKFGLIAESEKCILCVQFQKTFTGIKHHATRNRYH